MYLQKWKYLTNVFFQIVAILLLALVGPSMSYPYYYYGQGATFYAPQYVYPAPAPVPTAAPKLVQPSTVYSAADTTPGLNHLKVIHERTKPLVDQTEALANEIFPNDGAPIVQNGAIRTQYGESFLETFSGILQFSKIIKLWRVRGFF